MLPSRPQRQCSGLCSEETAQLRSALLAASSPSFAGNARIANHPFPTVLIPVLSSSVLSSLLSHPLPSAVSPGRL